MGHLVERFREVQQNGVRLSALIKDCSKVVDRQDELGVAGSLLPEAVLGVDQDVVPVKVLRDRAADDVLQHLPANRRQGDGAVVLC